MKTNYRLLDTGDMERLEDFGGRLVRRLAKQANWKPALSKFQWEKADTFFDGEKWHGDLSDFSVFFGENVFTLSPLESGQTGIFPEQAENWQWLSETVKNKNINILNGFAYTGGSTLFSSTPQNSVCHLDASRPAVKRAMENAALSNKESNSIRYITDDVLSFMEKEIKRENLYKGFIFDPPAFGRGSKNKVWKIDKDMPKLVRLMNTLSEGSPKFILLSAHEPSMDESDLKDLLAHIDCVKRNEIETGKLVMKAESGNHMTNGYYARVRY